jgi:hypothetical protein
VLELPVESVCFVFWSDVTMCLVSVNLKLVLQSHE